MRRATPGPLNDRSSASSYRLRQPRVGDFGWVVQRHGELYAGEYGWNEEFEAVVARIIAEFVEHFDRAWERGWIAERDEERIGCVFCVRKSETIAQLRMLLVEPSARGLGLGTRLVEECIAFARERGYREMMLWTERSLTAARRIYEASGFQLAEEDPHHDWGKDLVSQTWRLRL